MRKPYSDGPRVSPVCVGYDHSVDAIRQGPMLSPLTVTATSGLDAPFVMDPFFLCIAFLIDSAIQKVIL